ncbi:hypothetical protein JTE90_010274, partial [Oedothorax gibbosus]
VLFDPFRKKFLRRNRPSFTPSSTTTRAGADCGARQRAPPTWFAEEIKFTSSARRPFDSSPEDEGFYQKGEERPYPKEDSRRRLAPAFSSRVSQAAPRASPHSPGGGIPAPRSSSSASRRSGVQALQALTPTANLLRGVVPRTRSPQKTTGAFFPRGETTCIVWG